MLTLDTLLNLTNKCQTAGIETEKFNKQIQVTGDKSLSIRWVLLASQAIGKSKGYNLLMSEDVLAAINSIKKLGIKIKLNKNYCEIFGNGINGFEYKKNLTIDAKNSGTLGRLILGLLIKSPQKIKLIGDKSLSKRDFSRITIPLEKFGAKFYYKIKNKLPLTILVQTLNEFEKPIEQGFSTM